jgi:hypothetical protein
MSTLKSIIGIYILLWIISILTVPGSVYLYADIYKDNVVSDANFYAGEQLSSRGLTSDLSAYELSQMKHQLDLNNFDISKGKYLFEVSRYTTGNTILDFIPFWPYTSKFRLVNYCKLEGNVSDEQNLQTFFNPLGIDAYWFAWIVVLGATFIIIVIYFLLDFLDKRLYFNAYKLLTIGALSFGLASLFFLYLGKGMWLSPKIFLSHCIVHAAAIFILYKLIQLISRFNRPITEFQSLMKL